MHVRGSGRVVAFIGAGLMLTAAGITKLAAVDTQGSPGAHVSDPATIIHKPMGPGPGADPARVKDGFVLPPLPDAGPVAPTITVFGSSRADQDPGSSSLVSAAMTDGHNPTLNRQLQAIGTQHVFVKVTPAHAGDGAVTDVFFDLHTQPYSGPLSLFSVRPGGGELKIHVTGMVRARARLTDGRVTGFELLEAKTAVADDPSAMPPSTRRSASGD